MTVNKRKKPERYGCLSESLEAFLYMKEDKRTKRYGYGVNKYYQRIVKNVNDSFVDVRIAYNNLPEEQKNKIDLFSHIEGLINFAQEEKFEQTPDKIISQIRTVLYALLRGKIDIDPILERKARIDFENTIEWLDYLAPKNPTVVGAPT